VMPQKRIFIGGLPKWFWVVAVILLVFLLGIIDYETGDYSIIVFYMIPVVLATWFTGARFGIAVAVISGLVRLYADYETYTVFSSANYVNVAEDALFLLIIAGLIAILRKMLKGNKTGLPDTAGKMNQQG
jgi:K+-sensing histidine kinase KdpD